MRITNIQTTAVRVPLREPLKWTGGIRESASGLIVEIETDEGIVGVGEAPGPTLPVIQTIVDRELRPVPRRRGPAPHRVAAPPHGGILPQLGRRSPPTRSPGIEMALLDLKGKALGVPVAELLGGILARARFR